MWTEQSRGRMAQIAKKTKRYPSDLTDEEWEQIAPLMPKPGRRGRPREVDFREVINAVRYLVRSGCGWRMLPIHFGPWQTVYGWFRELARRFLFQTIHDVALMLDRERAGREASPTAGVIDSQSVKAPQAETRGYDAGKKIVGRKRHIAVDTDGRLLMVNLTTADISDSAGAQAILDGIRKRWPWVKHLFADRPRRDGCDDAASYRLARQIARAPVADRNRAVIRPLARQRDNGASLLRRNRRRRPRARRVLQPFRDGLARAMRKPARSPTSSPLCATRPAAVRSHKRRRHRLPARSSAPEAPVAGVSNGCGSSGPVRCAPRS
jgi:transposase